MGTFSNFAISFSIISILAGAITTFYLGMQAGGPLAITFSWVIVGIFATIIGASMGEICSTYPTAGGLYYWSAKLAKTNAPAWSWFTGWINLIGQVAITASIDYALATFIGFFITLYDADFTLDGREDLRDLPRGPGPCTACSTPSACGWSRCCRTSASGGTSSAH